MRFLTFVEIELRKVIPFLLGIFAVGTIVNTGMFVRTIGKVEESVAMKAMDAGITLEEFTKTNGKLSLAQVFDASPIFTFVFLFMALGIIGFGFYLWYKEWFGTSKRIYTLLTIKGSRLRIFTSKLTVFVVAFIALFGVMLVNLYIGSALMGLLLPDGTVADELVRNVMNYSQVLGFVFPVTLGKFLYSIGFIVMMFSILSVFVLMDRSKRLWGMIGGAVYGATTVGVFIYIQTLFLYTSERLIVNWLFAIVVFCVSMVQVVYLLNKKVSI